MTDHRDIVASPAAGGRPPTDWRFARRPGWILSHLFVLSCVVAFIFLAFWQLDRLHGRRDVNRMIEAREQEAPVPIETLVQPTEPADQANADTFRTVTVTGRYDTANQVLIRNRTRNNSDPGWWLITPLVSSDGTTAVAVNRGWVPYAIDENSSLDQFAPPTGTVTVTGLLMSTQNRAVRALRPGRRRAAHAVAGRSHPLPASAAVPDLPRVREPPLVGAAPGRAAPRTGAHARAR